MQDASRLVFMISGLGFLYQFAFVLGEHRRQMWLLIISAVQWLVIGMIINASTKQVYAITGNMACATIVDTVILLIGCGVGHALTAVGRRIIAHRGRRAYRRIQQE